MGEDDAAALLGALETLEGVRDLAKAEEPSGEVARQMLATEGCVQWFSRPSADEKRAEAAGMCELLGTCQQAREARVYNSAEQRDGMPGTGGPGGPHHRITRPARPS